MCRCRCLLKARPVGRVLGSAQVQARAQELVLVREPVPDLAPGWVMEWAPGLGMESVRGLATVTALE